MAAVVAIGKTNDNAASATAAHGSASGMSSSSMSGMSSEDMGHMAPGGETMSGEHMDP